jgi:hypothetical protein
VYVTEEHGLLIPETGSGDTPVGQIGEEGECVEKHILIYLEEIVHVRT